MSEDAELSFWISDEAEAEIVSRFPDWGGSTADLFKAILLSAGPIFEALAAEESTDNG